MTALEEIAHLADIRIDVRCRTGPQDEMTIAKILALENGTRDLRLSRSAGENIDLVIGGAPVGSGEIVIIEEAVGVRITDFKEDRLKRWKSRARYCRCCWCLLCWAALWALRRGGRDEFAQAGRGRRRARTQMESLERLALTPQHSLHLVKIGGPRCVVATHPQGCALLRERAQGDGA